MNPIIRVLIPIILTSLTGYWQDGPAAKIDRPHTSSVSGRVTLDGNPAAGVYVGLAPTNAGGKENTRSTKTDQDGRYVIDSLPLGYYKIQILAPALVASGVQSNERQIALQEGAKLENVDFVLVPGGVITGRVTDGGGSPLTGERPTLKVIDENGKPSEFLSLFFWQDFQTDDRGIYRIYGLPSGRYIISFGTVTRSPNANQMQSGDSKRAFPVTYYPNSPDEANSRIIEVKPGVEATGIDVTLTDEKSGFKATGTVVNADTGAPVAGVNISHEIFGTSWSSTAGIVRSGADGKFKLSGLHAGKHSLTLFNGYGGDSNTYSDAVNFEITDSDIDGLEIKIRRGFTVSGVVVFANPADEKMYSTLVNRPVFAIPSRTNTEGALNHNTSTSIAADHSFRLNGLGPGKYVITVANQQGDNFTVRYVEVPGMGRLVNKTPYPPYSFNMDPVVIGDSQNSHDISGVRIVLGGMHSVIRGKVTLDSGELPQNASIQMFICWGSTPANTQETNVAVDPDGQFVINALPAGQYVLKVSIYITGERPGVYQSLAHGTKIVSVAEGEETSVTVTVSPSGGQ